MLFFERGAGRTLFSHEKKVYPAKKKITYSTQLSTEIKRLNCKILKVINSFKHKS